MKRIFAFTAFILIMISCNRSPDRIDKPVVSISILPQQYFIEHIAGDRVEINVMIPPGASPATYEPSMAQLTSLHHSALYLRIGYIAFELSWMDKITSVNPSMKVVDISEGIELIRDQETGFSHGHGHGGIDPHLWMSPRNAKIIAKNTCRELMWLLPGEEKILKKHCNEMEKKLDSLDSTIRSMMAQVENRAFMIYHPALSYFAREYDMEQYPLEIGGKTPSPAHLRWLSDQAREKEISTIFLQMQFDNDNAEALARETGANIVQINPLDPDWYSQMLYIARTLAE